MSRIGKQPVQIPDGVTASIADGAVLIKGPQGELQKQIHPDIHIEVQEKEIVVSPQNATKQSGALWGLTRSLLANMVQGVTKQFEKKLVFEGVGYRVNVEGDTLVMQMGFSHPIRYKAPAGIAFGVEKNTISVLGIDKELVGRVAAEVRKVKPPEPYKGKGIRYKDEVIRRKAGKKAVASGG